MRRRGKLAIAAAAWLIARSGAAYADDSWITPNNGDWSDGTNWLTDNPPQTGDNVTNSFSGATISFETTASVNNVYDSGGLTINDGWLSVNSITAGSITLNGGTLSGSQLNSLSPADVSDMTIDGGVVSSLAIDLSSEIAFAGTSTLSNVTISYLSRPPGQASFSSQSSTTITGTATFAATATFTGGTINLASGALLVNESSFTGVGSIAGAGGAAGGVFQETRGAAVYAEMPGQTMTFCSSLSGFQSFNGAVQAVNGGLLDIDTPLSIQDADVYTQAPLLAAVQYPGFRSAGSAGSAPGTININNGLTTEGNAYPDHGIPLVDAVNGGTINIAGLWSGLLTTVDATDGGTINVGGGMTGSFDFEYGTNGLNVTGGTITDAQFNGDLSLGGNENVSLTGLVVLGSESEVDLPPLQYNGVPISDQENSDCTVTLNGTTLTTNAAPIYYAPRLAVTAGQLIIGTGAVVEGYGSIEPGILPASDEVWIDQGGELWANVSGQALNVGENIYIFAPGEGVIRVSQGAIFNVTDAQGSLGGIVQCDGTFNYTGGSTLTFAEIFGNGVINTNVNCTESLSPGDPAGTLSITGNLQQSANSAFKLFLAGATGGLDNGVLAVSGSAALSGTLDVSLVNGFVPSIGEQFTILTAGLGVTGAFTELQSAAYSSGSGYSTYGVIFDNNFNYTVEYNNNDVVLTITAVPEPGGISGIVLGGLGLLRRRRRRRGLL